MTSGTILDSVEQNMGVLPATLLYILLEWLLIFILFIDGILFFLATTVAHYFGLQMPCLHCTRIDRAFSRRDPDKVYRDSICTAHAKEMTTLAWCRSHGRLSNARQMCRDCLTSLTEVPSMNSSSEIYRALAAISAGAPMECSVDGKRRMHLKLRIGGRDECRHEIDRCSRVWECSCCGRTLRIRLLADGTEVPQIPLPPPVPKLSRSGKHSDWHGFEELAHVGCRDLRMTSDAESQTAVTDDSSSSVVLISGSECEETLRMKSSQPLYNKALSEGSIGILDAQVGSMSVAGSDSVVTKESPQRNSLELPWEKDINYPLFDSPKSAVAETGLNKKRGLQKSKSIGLDEAYAIATMNKQKQPSRLDHSKSTIIPRGMPVLRKRLSMGRERVVGLERSGSMGNVRWKSLLNRLKRQVCLGRKSLIALSTELDQERNASAVAVNQAMAMITRLQEEKAAVQMEALQYQRMMEEQAEYDQEALQVMSDLLVKRETRIKLLEDKVEAYSEQFQIECEKSGFKEMADDNYPKLRPCASTPSAAVLFDICASVNAGISVESDYDEEEQENFS